MNVPIISASTIDTMFDGMRELGRVVAVVAADDVATGRLLFSVGLDVGLVFSVRVRTVVFVVLDGFLVVGFFVLEVAFFVAMVNPPYGIMKPLYHSEIGTMLY